MAYLHNIYKVLAAILDSNSDPNDLKQVLNKTFDWEFLVKVGSTQLVLPAIYCNLKHKELLYLLPEDLQEYLQEITAINRNRNTTILEEVESISGLFKTHNIDYVYLKGAALLISGYYKDLGERMIGDVDILVHPNQLFKAQKLMLENGYAEAAKSLTDKYFNQKHLSRLLPKTNLAAVELHRRLLNKSLKDILEPLSVLQNKQVIKGVAICSDADFLLHAVLNFQINDYGYCYNYLGLRNAYDALVISNKMPKSQVNTLMSHRYIRSFFDKMSVYFKLDGYHTKSLLLAINTSFFILKQQYKFLSKSSSLFLNFINMLGLIFNRLYVMLTNPSYRKESFKDRKRIFKFIKEKINPF